MPPPLPHPDTSDQLSPLIHQYHPEPNLSTKSPTQQSTRDVITKRRTWKTMKNDRELVWPPYLEAALIEGAVANLCAQARRFHLHFREGLESYRPTGLSDIRKLSRFPKRNAWISEYILKTTGKVRTSRQVGSRLQQLRDTSKDPHGLCYPYTLPSPFSTIVYSASLVVSTRFPPLNK